MSDQTLLSQIFHEYQPETSKTCTFTVTTEMDGNNYNIAPSQTFREVIRTCGARNFEFAWKADLDEDESMY